MPQILLGLMVVVLGVIAVAAFSRSLRQLLRIRATPTSPLGMLPSYGSVEAVGQPLDTTGLSPIGSYPCAFWQVEVQEYRRSGKRSAWRTILTQSSGVPFAIGDGTGQAWVDPAGAELILRIDMQAESGFFTSLTPEILATLERMGISTTGFLGFKRNLRVMERLITPGETIYVLGGVDPTQGQPIIRAAPDAPLIIADRSESELLRSLYWQVAGWSLLAVIVFVGILIFLL